MSESQDNIRKRVGKACDRCRLKKSKCDGTNPCNRCKQDNAICVFGERKKSQDKVYPKGYVEQLEQNQVQLVEGLRELYRRIRAGEGWAGRDLPEAHSGHPLTHDILDALDVLHPTTPGGTCTEFEEDFGKMQEKLYQSGASSTRRRSSISSSSVAGAEIDQAHRLPCPPYAESPTTRSTPSINNFLPNQVAQTPSPMESPSYPQHPGLARAPIKPPYTYPPATATEHPSYDTQMLAGAGFGGVNAAGFAPTDFSLGAADEYPGTMFPGEPYTFTTQDGAAFDPYAAPGFEFATQPGTMNPTYLHT